MDIYTQPPNIVLYESRWAISEKHGNKIRKIFLHDAYSKIRKEVSLLQLSIGSEVNLSFDDLTGRWVCESDYLDLRPVLDNIDMNDFIKQLQSRFKIWRDDSRYRNLIQDEWSVKVVPWYCMLLHQFIDNSDNYITWLKNSCGEHFVHGDFTLSNIYLDYSNNVVVLDYENATLGPFLWDETTLVYSLIEQKKYREARETFNAFFCNKEMLQVICGIRLAQSKRKKQNVNQRTEAYEYVKHNY